MEKIEELSDIEPGYHINESENEKKCVSTSTFEEELSELPLEIQINSTEEELPKPEETSWEVHSLLLSQYAENLQDEMESTKSKIKSKRRRKRKSDNLITCQKCSATFKYQSTYDYHMKSKCGSRMIIDSNKLVKKHKKEMFTCNVCKKDLASRTSLMVHMRLHTGERPFTCDTCGRSFTQKVHMKDHMKIHIDEDPSQPQVFFCAECKYKCGDKQLLRSHLRVHFGDKQFECSICSKRFRTYSNRSNHRIIHSDKKDFVCSICGKEFLRKPSLIDHMKTHTKEKPFACDICGKEFADRTRRNTHVKRHTGELPQQCVDCGRKFAAAYDLRIHRRKHTGEKPYPCPVCGRMFNRKAIMDTHMTIHTGRKDYKCTQCDEAFNRKSKLDIHIAITHSNEIFCCSICKKVFKCKSYLVLHMKTHMDNGRQRIRKKITNRKTLRSKNLAVDFCKQIFVEAMDLSKKNALMLKPMYPQGENISEKFLTVSKLMTNGSSTESQEEDLENVIASMNNNDIDGKISFQALNEGVLLKSPHSADPSQPVEPMVFIKVESDC